MTERVLFVDDEKNVLEGIQRQLRRLFEVTTAQGPEEGLKAVKKNGSFAVIVSDLRMPDMDGIQFLSKVHEIAPDSVRMVLTGFADVGSAIKAVNEGHVFRILTKPCDRDALVQAIQFGIRQYKLVMAERVLLQKTLRGSIRLLSDVLSLVNPEAFGRASRVKRYALEIAKHMSLPDAWRVETAAMLSQVGCVILSEEVLLKVSSGRGLTEEELQSFSMHPGIGADLISRIPRMQLIADIIALQEKGFDGSGIPAREPRRGEEIPIGARILKVVLDFDSLENLGVPKGKALAVLKKRKTPYDPSVLAALEAVLGMEAQYERMEVRLRDLAAGMVLDQEVWSEKGQLVLSRGQEMTHILMNRLKSFAESTRIQEPIRVFVPLQISALGPE